MTRQVRLGLVASINLVMVVSLVLVGVIAHSLGVLASGADYLGDALGAALSLLAVQLSSRTPGDSRATSLAALANSGLLLLVMVAVAVEAILRLAGGAPSIDGLPVVVVSVLAAVSMIVCAVILGDVEDDLSLQSVMLDTVADAAAAIGVALAGTIILLAGGLYWLDSLVALLIALVVSYHAARLVRRTISALRRRHPSSSRTER